MPLQRVFMSCAVGVLIACASPHMVAQTSGYDLPPKNILDVMRAPLPPAPVVSPTKDKMLLVVWQLYPSIARVATPYLRLAGVRVEPKNHSKHDTPGGYGITRCATSFDLATIPSLAVIPRETPSTPNSSR